MKGWSGIHRACPSEIFHEFSKQVTGFESAQVRKEEAVKRLCIAKTPSGLYFHR
jgi:hypothetical protein